MPKQNWVSIKKVKTEGNYLYKQLKFPDETRIVEVKIKFDEKKVFFGEYDEWGWKEKEIPKDSKFLKIK